MQLTWRAASVSAKALVSSGPPITAKGRSGGARREREDSGMMDEGENANRGDQSSIDREDM